MRDFLDTSKFLYQVSTPISKNENVHSTPNLRSFIFRIINLLHTYSPHLVIHTLYKQVPTWIYVQKYVHAWIAHHHIVKYVKKLNSTKNVSNSVHLIQWNGTLTACVYMYIYTYLCLRWPCVGLIINIIACTLAMMWDMHFSMNLCYVINIPSILVDQRNGF